MQLPPARDFQFEVGQGGGGEAQIQAAVGAGAKAGHELSHARVMTDQEHMLRAVVRLLQNIEQGIGCRGVNAVVPADVTRVAYQIGYCFRGLAAPQRR